MMASTVRSKRFAGRVAVVTGAAGGIGQAVCTALVAEGAVVAGFDRNREASATLAERLGSAFRFYPLDLTQSEEVTANMMRVENELGPVDILVNNTAVTGSPLPTHAASPADFDAVFDVNVKATFLCARVVLGRMIAMGRKGAIVNASSINAVIGNADIPLYHATKAAVSMLARCDGVAYAERGIRINAVLPGSTRTQMSRAAAAISPEGDNYLSSLIARHPMGRQAEPEEIAAAILFLASEEASFITGTELAVDGGYTAQ
jgi:NAD(P)-dependent dehydrogenase (short-subunit alcohol dehydrogenase family)